jgi:anti-sigma B factor antagonist
MQTTGRISIDHRRNGITVVSVSGDLEGPMLTRARQALAVGHALSGDRAVVVDVSGLVFIGAEGLRVLRDGARALASTGGRLVLTGPSPHVARVLRVAGIDQTARVAYRTWPADAPVAA